SEAVGKEEQLKSALFEQPRNLDVILHGQKRHGVRGMTPEGMTMRHLPGDQKPGEMHVTLFLAHDSLPLQFGTNPHTALRASSSCPDVVWRHCSATRAARHARHRDPPHIFTSRRLTLRSLPCYPRPGRGSSQTHHSTHAFTPQGHRRQYGEDQSARRTFARKG